jgi:para-nitrobenzyl esterase
MHQPVATIAGHGEVQGTHTQGVCRFSAIPYAEPPVGALRWQAPQPARWRGTRRADAPGPIAPQWPSRLREAMGDFASPQSEDCLHLTVWTPAADAQRRPVVVWLHGGAWQSGAGALDWYDGAALAAAGDVVVVSPNYRLGPMGWLHLPGGTANAGLLDQALAIQWVRQHAAAFGGDPTRITVMGQSAGAMNAACLLTRDDPGFARVILQSTPLGGGARSGVRSAAQAARLADAWLQALGVADLAGACAAPLADVLQAQQAPAVQQALRDEGTGRPLFGPVADGQVLAEDMNTALRDAPSRADVLIGYTRDEMLAFPGMQPGAASQAAGDALFGAPSHDWAARAQGAGRQAWGFRFDNAPTTRFGACHCIELPFVFGSWDAFAQAPMLHGMARAQADALTAQLQPAWLDFIRGASPGWAPAPAWQHFA